MRIYIRYFIWIVALLLQFAALSKATNCADPPNAIAPQDCCNFPQLIKQNLVEYCKNKPKKGNKCFYECIYSNTEMTRRKQVDYRKAADYVDWVWPGDNDFKDVYKRAYRECMGDAPILMEPPFKLEPNECNPRPEQTEICVQNKMFTLCPPQYFNSNKTECIEKREFFQNCEVEV